MTNTQSAALNCRHCQQPFRANKHNQQFCSDACRGKHFRQLKRVKGEADKWGETAGILAVANVSNRVNVPKVGSPIGNKPDGYQLPG